MAPKRPKCSEVGLGEDDWIVGVPYLSVDLSTEEFIAECAG